ncbi:MAG: hypothetical protein IJ165_09140 [Proteobacteria bacterium]|nr:hypothetical protein [Pseudomonadota bacterium]
MAVYENYNNATTGRFAAAVAGCILGGGIIMFLGILGASGDYQSLPQAGYNGLTIPFYALVVISGFLLLFRVRYAILIALGAEAIEMVCYITKQMSTSPDVGILILLKLAVIVCCMQLMLQIDSFSEDDDEEEVPQQPVARRLPPGAPQPRRTAQVGRGQAPRPKR